MAKKAPRNTTTYRFVGADGEEKHCGITDDPKRRQGEHRRHFNEPDGTLNAEGGRKTRAGGRAWEKEQGCSPFDKPTEPPKKKAAPRSAEVHLGRVASSRRSRGSGGLGAAIGTALGVVATGVLVAAVLDTMFGGSSPPTPPSEPPTT
jgi:hypothetical protein